ncbi:hypothetical protein C8Q78DRAFT_628726 [Trametes maxima]|nr:hypothetical protein C8Q78DRAFT_628726 [Trametes maxima]
MSAYTAPLVQYPAYLASDPLAESLASPFITDPPLTPHNTRPHLHVSTDYTLACQDTGEYLVRDFFTPSPTSGSSSDYDGSSTLPYVQRASVPNQPHPSPTASSRREARKRGAEPPSPLDGGLVVRGSIAHPYARLYSKKHGTGKRRKMWNHALEKMLFSPQEISTMGAPHRRTIYTASLEAHVDRLHEQLLSLSLFPVPFEKLEPYRGLNSKTAKSMVSGLQHDAAELKLKILELERANRNLEESLRGPQIQYKAGL